MVKIQTRQAKKNYLKGKNVYDYGREQVTITKKYHQTSKHFHDQELDETVWVENGSLMIKLTPKKAAP
jgi:ribosomal protein L25 (general stress protein Ctc)